MVRFVKLTTASIADFFILVSVIANVAIMFLARGRRPKYPNLRYHEEDGATMQRRSFRPDDIFSFDDESAEGYLGFLKRSENYVDCHNSRSELGCSSIFKAAEKMKEWEEGGKTRGPRFVLCSTTGFDFSQKVQTESVCLAYAIMTNRTLLISSDSARESPSIIKDSSEIARISQQFNPLQILNQDHILEGGQLSTRSEVVASDDVLFFGVLYIHPDLYDFCKSTFDLHAAFFLSNFLYNPLSLGHRRNESTSFLFGVDMEIAKAAKRDAKVGAANIKKRLKAARAIRQMSVNLVTDATQLENELTNDFGKLDGSVILTDSSNFEASLGAAALILSSHETVLTLQSPFAHTISKMTTIRPWWYEREHGRYFALSSSQALLINPLANNCTAPQANSVLHMTDEGEFLMRHITRHFFL